MKRRTWLTLAVLVVVVVAGWLVAARLNGSATPVDAGRVATREVFRSYVTASGEIVSSRKQDGPLGVRFTRLPAISRERIGRYLAGRRPE